MSNNKKRLIIYVLLFVVLIIAIFLRLYNLKSIPPGLYPDEAMNGNNAVEALETKNFKVFYPENNGREGLFINIIAFFIWLFGAQKIWVLRLASSIFGIFTVLGVFLVVKEFLYKHKHRYEIALLSSFFVSISFWHLIFSRIAFRAIMAPFFLVWSSYITLSALNKMRGRKDNKKQYLVLSALGGFVYGLGMHSYISYRATPLIFIFLFLIYWLSNKVKFNRILHGFIIFVAFALISFAPLGIYFIQHPHDFLGRTSQISIFDTPDPIKSLITNTIKTLGMFNFEGDHNWRHNYSGRPELHWFVGLLFLFGIISEMLLIYNKKSRRLFLETRYTKDRKVMFFVSLFWIIVGILPVIFSNEGIPHALRAILIIPPVYVISALGGYNLFKIISRATTNYRVLLDWSIFVLILLAINTYCLYFFAWANNKNVYDAFAGEYVLIGDQINNYPNNIKKYVVVDAWGVDVRGVPMPAQTVMFITKSFTYKDRLGKNIEYILPSQKDNIQEKSLVFYIK